ncbi:MAG: hypothetical protein ACFFBC_09475 [Promethearchaeota archaeon]
MIDYDYNVKVVLTGDDSEGKSHLATNFCKNFLQTDSKSTIGLEFHVKTLPVLGKTMKMQLWELVITEKFKPHLFSYYKGALGAIIVSDISQTDFRVYLDETIQMIKEQSGDIPIILLTFDLHSERYQVVSGLESMLTAGNFNGLTFKEGSLKQIQNPELIFNKLGEYIIERINMDPPIKPFKRPQKITTKFRINKYLKLKLEHGHTNIYVGGKLFKQCKFLLLDIPITSTSDYNEIESIDEAAEKLDHSMERGQPRKYYISPDIEFWGHCSNLQVWYENNYDSRILHSSLAFPLLKALVNVGDPLAKKVFKEEIALRLSSGYPSVVKHIINQGYLNNFTKEEKNTLINDPSFLKNLPKWFADFKDIPKWLSKRINAVLNDLQCPFCSSKVSPAVIKKFLLGNSIKCEFCYRDVI